MAPRSEKGVRAVFRSASAAAMPHPSRQTVRRYPALPVISTFVLPCSVGGGVLLVVFLRAFLPLDGAAGKLESWDDRSFAGQAAAQRLTALRKAPPKPHLQHRMKSRSGCPRDRGNRRSLARRARPVF